MDEMDGCIISHLTSLNLLRLGLDKLVSLCLATKGVKRRFSHFLRAVLAGHIDKVTILPNMQRLDQVPPAFSMNSICTFYSGIMTIIAMMINVMISIRTVSGSLNLNPPCRKQFHYPCPVHLAFPRFPASAWRVYAMSRVKNNSMPLVASLLLGAPKLQ